MDLRKPNAVVMLLLIALVAAPALVAQTSTTGAIEGTVTDNSGTTLPGVTVEIRSPQLQGTKTEVTDAQGRFRFPLLPPGNYSLTATLTGFSPIRHNNVVVALSRTVTLDVQMSAAMAEQITVTAAAPVVDVTSATTGANVTAQTMQSLPIARNFTAVAQVAPGTNADATGTTIYGSSGAENQYVIDGLNTTNVRLGTEGKILNFDFIQEVEVKTGGMPAEYGRMTGGLINAITKSGGNAFTGDAFLFNQPRGIRADNQTLTERPFTFGTAIDTKSQNDYGADLGGYFVKDRLWFFGAYNHQDTSLTNHRINQDLVIEPSPELPGGYILPLGSEIATDTKSELYAAKLTFRATENQNVTFSLFGDPTKTTGALFGVAGPPTTTEGELRTGGSDYIARYNGIFGTTFLVNAEAGHHHEDATIDGAGMFIPQIIDQTVSPNTLFGGFGFFNNNTYDRDIAKLSFTKFLANHEIKIGGDYEDMNADVENYQGGAGQRIYKRLRNGAVYFRHRYYVDDLAPGFDRDNSATWKIALPQVAQPETKNTSLFLQDSWRVVPNLTINAGVRWESQELLGRGGVRATKIDDNIAPRVGVIWDVLNNGRSKLYANYGKFYENIPMDINIRAFGGELVCFCYNFDVRPSALEPDPTAPARSSLLGGATPVDPNLKGQYINEYLIGYDHEIAQNLAIGIKGTYRNLGRVIEDMLEVPITGAYIITNPGSGIGREAGFYDFEHTVLVPKAKRIYKGVEVSATKRFSNNYQFFASYLWSRLEGNYDGTFQASTGQLDPNINSAYDYADFAVNNDGLLSNDRTHQVKFFGSYLFPGGSMLSGLTIGVAAHYASGTPLTAAGYSQAYQNWEYYLTPRGSLGRGPADYEADLHFSYPISVGAGRLNVIADVFNVLDRQAKTAVDLRYNRAQDEACTGFIATGSADPCNGDGGITTEPNTLITAGRIDLANAPNPDFLKAGIAFTAPRTFRLGIRYSF